MLQTFVMHSWSGAKQGEHNNRHLLTYFPCPITTVKIPVSCSSNSCSLTCCSHIK